MDKYPHGYSHSPRDEFHGDFQVSQTRRMSDRACKSDDPAFEHPPPVITIEIRCQMPVDRG